MCEYCGVACGSASTTQHYHAENENDHLCEPKGACKAYICGSCLLGDEGETKDRSEETHKLLTYLLSLHPEFSNLDALRHHVRKLEESKQIWSYHHYHYKRNSSILCFLFAFFNRTPKWTQHLLTNCATWKRK
jgi:hypothetical protein